MPLPWKKLAPRCRSISRERKLVRFSIVYLYVVLNLLDSITDTKKSKKKDASSNQPSIARTLQPGASQIMADNPFNNNGSQHSHPRWWAVA